MNRVCSKPRSRVVTNLGACSLPIFGMGSFFKHVSDLLSVRLPFFALGIDR